MKKIFSFIVLLYVSVCIHAQEIPVNTFTGTPVITFPFASVSDKGVIDNFGLSYNAKGVSIKSTPGYYGQGWTIYGGGMVSREVRGLPDDHKGGSGDNRRGWLHGANITTSTFANTSDNTSATCVDEYADYNKLNGFNYLVDTEPDIFHFQVGGAAGSFVFDNTATLSSPNVRLNPYQDIKIEPTINATSGKITGFTITTIDGNIHVLSNAATESRKIVYDRTPFKAAEFDRTTFGFYYSSIAVDYNTRWHVTTTTSPLGGKLTYTYSVLNYPASPNYDPDNSVMVTTFSKQNGTYTNSYQYRWVLGSTDQRLSKVTSTDDSSIEFDYTVINTENTQDKGVLTLVSIKKAGTMLLKFYPQYAYVGCGHIVENCAPPGSDDIPGAYDYSKFKRAFLKNISQGVSECEKLPPTEFTYYHTDVNSAVPSTLLPAPNSVRIDLWGYYTGRPNTSLVPKLYVYPGLSAEERYRVFPKPGTTGIILDGADRSVNPNTIDAGALKAIHYPTGGRTILEYEPNEFYDPVAGLSFQGGGLRVKTITAYDGVNENATARRTYKYVKADGTCSGKIDYKPSYGIPMGRYVDGTFVANYDELVANGMDPWKYLTARTDVDMAPTQGNVYYERVEVSSLNTGSVVTEFELPGMWNDFSSGEWHPSLNKFARYGCVPLKMFDATFKGIYPYAPNPLSNYMLGLVKKEEVRNEQGNWVTQTTILYNNFYKSGNAAYNVSGVQYDKIPNTTDGFYFSKYALLTDVLRLPVRKEVKIRDENDFSKTNTIVEEYTYGSQLHKFVTSLSRTESDGSVYVSHFKYPLDYGTVPSGADIPSFIIGRLQTSFQIGTPIEKYTTVSRNGTTKYTEGTVVKYNLYNDKALPNQKLTLRAVPLATFTPSYIDPTTKTFKTDANYQVVETINSYNAACNPTSLIGEDNIVKNIIYSHNNLLPALHISDADFGEIAVCDFDEVVNFTVTNMPAGTVKGRTGKGTYPTAKLNKNVQKTGSKYVISGWMKNTNTTVTLTLKIQSADGVTTYLTSPIQVPAASSSFEYFERQINLPAAVPSSFKVNIEGSYTLATDGVHPLMDDIMFYPVHADIAHTTYNFPFGPSSITLKDKTVFTYYDNFGNVTEKRDKENNILSLNSYSFSKPSLNYLADPTINNGTAVQYSPCLFTVSANCSDLTYEWSFEGEAFAVGSSRMTYTFNTSGLKTIRLRVTHPVAGSKTVQKNVSVKMGIPD